MKIDKNAADHITRVFRAEMNKTAKDGITRESVFALANGYAVEYTVSVQKQVEWKDAQDG